MITVPAYPPEAVAPPQQWRPRKFTGGASGREYTTTSPLAGFVTWAKYARQHIRLYDLSFADGYRLAWEIHGRTNR